MLELVPDCGRDPAGLVPLATEPDDIISAEEEARLAVVGCHLLLARPSATIHYIYDPFNPSFNAIVSVARRLQEVLIEHNALPEGGALPFPALAPIDYI